MYKDDHEGEILQADGETVKKVMINEASTLLEYREQPEGNKYRITRTDHNEA